MKKARFSDQQIAIALKQGGGDIGREWLLEAIPRPRFFVGGNVTDHRAAFSS